MFGYSWVEKVYREYIVDCIQCIKLFQLISKIANGLQMEYLVLFWLIPISYSRSCGSYGRKDYLLHIRLVEDMQNISANLERAKPPQEV